MGNNGTINGKKYFECTFNCGLFIKTAQILQIYSPENLLEMIINLKDKVLPLMAMVNKQHNNTMHKTQSAPPNTAKQKESSNETTSQWPSPKSPSHQFITKANNIPNKKDTVR